MKKILNYVSVFILCFFVFLLIYYNELTRDSILGCVNIFMGSVFPSLFPYMIISSLLINFNITELLNKVFKSPNIIYIFLMSMISGFPSGSINIKNMYKKNMISLNNANKCLIFTHFSNPLFIFGTLNIFFRDTRLCIYIFVSHYLANIILFLIIRPKEESLVKFKPIDFSKSFNNAVTNSLRTLSMILGVMIIFSLVSNMLSNVLNLSELPSTILTGLFEITNGLKMVSLLNITDKLKAILATLFLSFGGISIHMQVINIISDTKIKYSSFLGGRVLQSLISVLILIILL